MVSPPLHSASYQKAPAPAISSAAASVRKALLAFGVLVALSGLWLLLPELLRPKAAGLAHDKASAAAAGDHRLSALLAAYLGGIRGDLWADAAFADSSLMWLDRAAALTPANAARIELTRSRAETALAYSPINGAAWLLLANLPGGQANDGGVSFLENAYLTAPNESSLADMRLERAATSNALADKDVQIAVKNEIRKILTYQPRRKAALVAAYRNAPPQNQAILDSLVGDVDPAVAQSLRAGTGK
ncbi:hypothetical protein [Methylocapsa acidiphila]|uniref:hypothetical protein n=1 Tax=Methylocapsa acidiphila TaxID=133552 RepID=UPI00041A6977|nr:hypothetical protein [Methylocapsa acidiphila]